MWILENLFSLDFLEKIIINTDANFELFHQFKNNNKLILRSRLEHLRGDHVSMNLIIEDDLIFGRDFLQFCLVNLDKFKNNNAIGSITGYMPINIQIPQTPNNYLNVSHPFFSAWGWASWLVL